MISKIKFNIVAVFILALGVFAGAALAQDTTTAPKQDDTQKQDKFERHGGGRRGGREGFGGPRRGGPEAMLGMFRDLNLTDAQKAQIKTILDSNKPDQAELDQMKAVRESRKNGTELTAEQKEQLKASRDAQRAKMQAVHEQIMNVLTPEQKTQLEAKRKEMDQRFQDRKQYRRDDKPAADKTNTSKPVQG